MVRALAESGIDLDVGDKNSLSPLHMTALEAEEGMVETLIERGASVNAIDKDKWTPTKAAAIRGHWLLADRLLRALGLNDDAMLQSMNDLDMELEDLEQRSFLLQGRANSKLLDGDKVESDSVGAEDSAVLWEQFPRAVGIGSMGVVKRYLRAGIDINKPDQAGKTAL